MNRWKEAEVAARGMTILTELIPISLPISARSAFLARVYMGEGNYAPAGR